MRDLYSFEINRRSSIPIPPVGSNSFYPLDEGEINLLCLRNTERNERFDLFIEEGTIYTGASFSINGNIYDNTKPYNNMTIKTGSRLILDGLFTISKGELDCHGEFIIQKQLKLEENGTLLFYPDSTWKIEAGSTLDIENGGIIVYGKVEVDASIAQWLLTHPNITWDSAAIVDVIGINTDNKIMSLRDYERYMRDIHLAVYSSHIIDTETGSIRAAWTGSNYDIGYQSIILNPYRGETVLGNFKLSAMGTPERNIPNTQLVTAVTVWKDATLYITDEFHDSTFIYPELYLGVTIGNSSVPGYCDVDGTVVVSGPDSKITLDRGGYLSINKGGTVRIERGAHLISAYNGTSHVLYIDGTLVIENMESLVGLKAENITFGIDGKIVILNQYSDENHLLYTVEEGFKDTQLYQLFGARLRHVEYHIQPNTGIEIGVFYDYFSRDLLKWFGNYRIEDAVARKLVVWHENGFIRLSDKNIWWVDDNCDLIVLSQIFKSIGLLGADRLKEVASRLQIAGFESIRFILEIGEREKEIIFSLNYPKMMGIRVDSSIGGYVLKTDKDGQGFVRKNASTTTSETIIHEKSKRFPIVNGEGVIILE